MNILFVSGVAPIVRDLAGARGLYEKTLGIPLHGDEYPIAEGLEGVRHFGVWTLAGAAQSCFVQNSWPEEIPAPNASVEFEVTDVDQAARELHAAGHRILREASDEPWGQRVARVLTPDGLLIGVTHTPQMLAG
jgi:catechol 2,3-dioxygenase-like lactoylglutathione lyase family enzyme